MSPILQVIQSFWQVNYVGYVFFILLLFSFVYRIFKIKE